MDSPEVITILRLLHVVVGAIWVGAVVFVTFFLQPTVQALGPAGGQVMAALIQRTRLPAWMTTIGVVTLLSGAALYGIFYGGTPWSVFGAHVVYGVGGILTLVVMALGFAVTRPAGARLGALAKQIAGQGSPPTKEQLAEREALSNRLGAAAWINVVLLLIIISLMAVARYL